VPTKLLKKASAYQAS